MSNILFTNAFAGRYAPVHQCGMNVPEVLKAIAEAAKVKQTGLGELIGISQPQISRLMGGADPRKGSLDKIEAAARKYGVLDDDVRSEDVAATLPVPPRPKMVPIKGYVGAGSEMHYYRVADDRFEEVEAPDDARDKTVALEIKGHSWGPLMESWLVFYDDIHVRPAELIGRTCVVGLADDRILVKRIERGKRGGFDLISNNPNEPAIENADIEWAALVTSMRQRK